MAEGAWGDAQYVSEQFRRHYQRAGEPPPPQDFRSREFGFLSFEGKAMQRHIAFRTPIELRRYLAEQAPAHVYYSSAYYSRPEEEMEFKGWLGADLVFDIDADHIDTPCKTNHDLWECTGCGRRGAGKAPEKCPICGRAAFKEETWICERCLESAKYEAQKLLDILIQDFGFSPSSELGVNFSGNRGYHIHVTSPRVRMMGQLARREIVDYVSGIGIEAEHQGLGRLQVGPPVLAEVGWRGRSARALYDYLMGLGPDTLNGLRLSKAAAQGILESKEEILATLRESHPGGVLKYMDPKTLGRLLEAAVREQASAVDTVVTTDLHRLIRLPNTLNGKTGWLAQAVGVDGLEDYDPLLAASPFSGPRVKVHVRRVPRFRLGDETFGPFEGESVELSPAAAIFLLLRRAARLER